MSLIDHRFAAERVAEVTRTLSPTAQKRIILQLASPDGFPLDIEQANSYNHVLRRNEKGRSDSQLTVREDSIFLDFQPQKVDGDPTSLNYAVVKTETALVRSGLAAVILHAWEVDADSPSVNALTSDEWQKLPEVSQQAHDISRLMRPLLEEVCSSDAA